MKKDINYKNIKKEWDDIAFQRYSDLKEGNDISYERILKPNFLSQLLKCDMSNVLDIGCGVGIFTKQVSKISNFITAIDISEKSIEISNKYCNAPNIKYQVGSLEDIGRGQFTTIISNMTLMTIPDISEVFLLVNKNLVEKGKFVFTITHPSFWPIYWEYYSDPDFLYIKETEVFKEFKTRKKVYNGLYTRHYHRPVEYYMNLIISAGLVITSYRTG